MPCPCGPGVVSEEYGSGAPPLGGFCLVLANGSTQAAGPFSSTERGDHVSILWIIIIVIVVLAVLGYFGRGRFSR